MKLFILCRRIGDSSPGPWGPGWAPYQVFTDTPGTWQAQAAAFRACRDVRDQFDENVYQFTVVVAEYDARYEE